MDAFLHLSPEDRREACLEAEARTRLRAVSIEKDYWVSWTLRALFELPEWGGRLTFKGGTSLSKVWQLIERFSEDIDVVIDRDFLGFAAERSPEHAPSRTKQRQWLDGLKAASQSRIRDSLQPTLAEAISTKLGGNTGWRVELDPADPDGQTLLFDYPTVFEPEAYIAPRVKIELGARSDTDPNETVEIEPYLAAALPNVLGPSRFPVRVVAARRTFWEKAMLLHEENHRPPQRKRLQRLSRHYYDLACLIQHAIADQAMAEAGLFDRVLAHRRVFFRYTWMDYDTMKPGTLRLLPPEEERSAWARDYDAMRDTMFFRSAPTFDEILRVVGEFERRFNSIGVASA
ncbi:MAG: nucleotidyl transferase AbiEii/AbiGii toxin family protein [Betaproteobacteria bacterium]|nr:nucleotidyl transferase AbiEii/AbiGii toxin family protein [Betaproteobacteria bacterium]